jgi:hypothetical protein
LQSSNRIELSDITSDDSKLGGVWGGPFYHPAFVDSAIKLLNLAGKASYINIDGNCAGIINLLCHKKLGIRVASTPLLFQYFGPSIFQSFSDEPIGSELDELLRSYCDFAFFSLPPCGANLELSRDWKVINTFTLAITEPGLMNWGNGFRDDVKNKIRKASRENIHIAEVGKLPTELWRTTFARRKMPPPVRPELLEQWANSLISKSLLRVYVAEIDGAAVAFRGELILGRYAYDWLAGSDPKFHATGANQLLMAEIGAAFSKLGFMAWDLVGGEIKSIVDFKKSFGASEIPHIHAWRSFNIRGEMFSRLRRLRHG